MDINPTLFREYDIRGRIDAPDELTPDAIRAINRGFAAFLKKRGIHEAIVAHDSRAYSKDVKEITVAALRTSGIDVIDIGEVLVPMFYFSQYHLQKPGGVMITASHNPWGWSGFKHAYDYSTTLVPETMRELAEFVRNEAFPEGEGGYTAVPNIVEAYTADVLGRINIARPLKVLVDTGNGTAGPIVPAILRKAGCEVFEQYTEVAKERHHDANPSTIGMLEAMTAGLKGTHADIALGFDDDGDRLGVVDDRGEVVWPDRILVLLARAMLVKKPGATVVFDVKCTEALPEDIRAHGGKAVMWKTGHSYIKAKSKELNAELAGERSGHIFFREGYYGFDDATFAGLKLLEYLSGETKPLSEIVATIPPYITSPVWHAPVSDLKKYGIVEELTQELTRELGTEKVVAINGARAYLEDGWGLIRASSNVPALVLVFESKTSEGLKRIEEYFRKKLARFPEVGSEWVSG